MLVNYYSMLNSSTNYVVCCISKYEAYRFLTTLIHDDVPLTRDQDYLVKVKEYIESASKNSVVCIAPDGHYGHIEDFKKDGCQLVSYSDVIYHDVHQGSALTATMFCVLFLVLIALSIVIVGVAIGEIPFPGSVN